MQPVTTAGASTDGHPVVRSPSPYRARAWWGDRLVADSTAVVQVEEPGGPPSLWFPVADVRFDLFQPGGGFTCPVKGAGSLWTIEGTVVPETLAWGDAEGPAPVDGRDVLWRVEEPAAGLEWLAGLAAFDHDRVRVDLVCPAGLDAPDDEVATRFPAWGDAADLIDVMDVRPDGERRWVSVPRADQRRPVVEGSQMLGQAIVAAMRHTGGRRVVSAHMIFYRPADARLPLEIELEELTAGRTFTALVAHVSQDGRRRAGGTLLLDATAPDVIRHAAPAPPAAGPRMATPYDMAVTGRAIRMVDDAYTDDPAAPAGPPVIDTWVRFREAPADPALHAGLLAQFTGHISIAAALRPHEGVGQRSAHRTLSMGINAISLSLHADVRADRWMRYHHHSTFAGDGMTHSECRVYTEDGDLVASFSVEAMVRGFGERARGADDRTAI